MTIPAIAQTTLWGPNNSSTVAFWYLGKDSSGSNIQSCCSGLTYLYYAASKLYLPSTYSNPQFSSSPSRAWYVDQSSRTNNGDGNVWYAIKVLDPPTAQSENVTFTDGDFTSNAVSVYVNAPHSISVFANYPSNPPGLSCNNHGWSMETDRYIQDRTGGTLTPIDAHETLENYVLEYSGENWPNLTANTDVWASWLVSQIGSPGSWITTNNTIPDWYRTCDDGTTLTPVPHSTNSDDPNHTLIYSMTQKIWVGSGTKDFTGVCVLMRGLGFYQDIGKALPGRDYSPPQSSCAAGNYANNQ